MIEKFEENADVAFAVVLLTPDDAGKAVGDSEVRPRARQNVILELGYFTASLGRARVCALHTGNVEIPSDFSGVVYVHMDSAGAWKLELARELKEAGIAVSLDEAFLAR